MRVSPPLRYPDSLRLLAAKDTNRSRKILKSSRNLTGWKPSRNPRGRDKTCLARSWMIFLLGVFLSLISGAHIRPQRFFRFRCNFQFLRQGTEDKDEPQQATEINQSLQISYRQDHWLEAYFLFLCYRYDCFDLSRFTYAWLNKTARLLFPQGCREVREWGRRLDNETLETKRNVWNNRSVQALYSFFSIVDPQGLVFKLPLSDVWSRGNHTFCQGQSRSQALTRDGR